MATIAERELTQDMWETLREHFRVSGKALFSLRQKLTLPENGSYVIKVTLGDNLGRIAKLPIVLELRSSESFRSLANFVNSLPALQILFLKSSAQPIDESHPLKESLNLV